MKPNLLFHPVIRVLCMVLCIGMICVSAYCVVRCFYMEDNHVMEASPYFHPLTYQSSTMYWPTFAWNYYASSSVLEDVAQNRTEISDVHQDTEPQGVTAPLDTLNTEEPTEMKTEETAVLLKPDEYNEWNEGIAADGTTAVDEASDPDAVAVDTTTVVDSETDSDPEYNDFYDAEELVYRWEGCYSDTLLDIVNHLYYVWRTKYQKTQNGSFADYLDRQAIMETELGIYPDQDWIASQCVSFLEQFPRGGSNFCFRVSFNGKTMFANTDDDTDFKKDIIENAGGRYESVLRDSRTVIVLEYGLRRGLPCDDVYQTAYQRWASDCSFWEMWLLSAGASALAALILLVLVLYQSGMRYRTPGVVHLTKCDRLPLEVTFAVKSILMILLCALIVESTHQLSDVNRYFRLIFGYETGNMRDYLIPILQFVCILLLCVLGISILREFVRRFRGGYWWHHTIVWMLWRFCKNTVRRIVQLFRQFFDNLPILWRWVVTIGLFGLWTLFVMVADGLAFVWILSATILGIAGCIWFVQLDAVRRGAEEIAGGNLKYQIATDRMFRIPKSLAEALNRIGDAAQIAVEERMKSERFRSELITNVSHDLKTPLTSIINYTDLLSREECENETMKEYIAVLGRQANRLKKLTDDLLEASKASSGVLPVMLAPTDAAELLTQAFGEYEERFEKQKLHPVIDIQNQPLLISADGRHLWRVFDNLLSNICKYSMPGTRVYLTALKTGERVLIVFRNISAESIRISAEELTERFVRGDTSRHTEGSGLGLAIADSLTTLQGGKLQVSVDGDLFKVVLEFSSLAPESGENGT